MQGFDPVTFGWKGEEYTVEAERQLMLVAKIEDALSAGTGEQALTILLRPEGPPYARLACAYGAALRYAGADVSDEDVYLSMMEGFAKSDVSSVTQAQAAVLALIHVVSPPMGRIFSMGTEKKTGSTKKDKKA